MPHYYAMKNQISYAADNVAVIHIVVKKIVYSQKSHFKI